MPDQRKHRGPHPKDRQLFDSSKERILRTASGDMNWLLSRGYAPNSTLKLVGDRFDLTARQRLAISRCTCSDFALARRQRHQVDWPDLANQELWIDGYNALTTVEAALSGGVILRGRDGCYRDMASMHGSYRKVEETVPAIEILGELISQWNVAGCRWLLDQPVSNSGRLKTMLAEVAQQHDWNWQAETVADPDPVLIRSDQIVASADSQILDKTERWFNLARVAIETRVPEAWIMDLSS